MLEFPNFGNMNTSIEFKILDKTLLMNRNYDVETFISKYLYSQETLNSQFC